MKRWLIKHERSLQPIITGLVAVLTSVYVNVLTSSNAVSQHFGTNAPPTPRTDFGGVMSSLWMGGLELGWWNLVVAASVALLIAQIYLSGLGHAVIRVNRDQIIREILEGAARTLVYPNSKKHIRAIVTLFNHKRGQRDIAYTYAADPDPDRAGSMPADFGVTGEAFTGKCVVLKDLPADHYDKYDAAMKALIPATLKSVMAAVIRDPMSPTSTPLGTLAFDSTLSLKELHVKSTEDQEMRTILQQWADLIAVVLAA